MIAIGTKHERSSPVSTGITSTLNNSEPKIYVECQRSVPIQEVGCPLCVEAERKGVEVRAVDGRV